MQERTKVNGAPAWGLTELTVEKGRMLAKEYGVDESLVATASYLAHIVFSKERDSEIMKNHMFLSAKEAEEKLLGWGADTDIAQKVKRAIELHHTPTNTKDLYFEVVKNADCFKFLSIEGMRVFLEDLKERGMSEDEAQEYAKYKVKQKYGYLTLNKAKEEVDAALAEIEKMLDGTHTIS